MATAQVMMDSEPNKRGHLPHGPASAACKRASMDLTRALADLRRDDYSEGPK